jgi:hypothetical protein
MASYSAELAQVKDAVAALVDVNLPFERADAVRDHLVESALFLERIKREAVQVPDPATRYVPEEAPEEPSPAPSDENVVTVNKPTPKTHKGIRRSVKE